jgi:aspartate 1-decarboxylase
MLFAKIHRATVTDAQLHYEGSLSIDAHLLAEAGLREFQQIQVYNIRNGQRFETYVLAAPAHSGTIQVNGAAAHLASRGDLLIIAAYVHATPEEAQQWQPRLVFVAEDNRPAPKPNPLLMPV